MRAIEEMLERSTSAATTAAMTVPEPALQDTTFTSLKSLLNILKCSTREFSLAPNVLFFVLILPICMF